MQPDTANINISDEVLIQQCRDGDSAAMERLIIKYKDRLYNVILRICSNPHDAAELTQDVFVKIIENLHRFLHLGLSDCSEYNAEFLPQAGPGRDDFSRRRIRR